MNVYWKINIDGNYDEAILEEIVSQIKEGFTSGIIENKDEQE